MMTTDTLEIIKILKPTTYNVHSNNSGHTHTLGVLSHLLSHFMAPISFMNEPYYLDNYFFSAKFSLFYFTFFSIS